MCCGVAGFSIPAERSSPALSTKLSSAQPRPSLFRSPTMPVMGVSYWLVSQNSCADVVTFWHSQSFKSGSLLGRSKEKLQHIAQFSKPVSSSNINARKNHRSLLFATEDPATAAASENTNKQVSWSIVVKIKWSSNEGFEMFSCFQTKRSSSWTSESSAKKQKIETKSDINATKNSVFVNL